MQSTKKPEVKSYKQLLVQCKQLMGKAGMAAFERATLLGKVFDDDEFRADNGLLDDFAAGEYLDQYVGDLIVGYLELRALLEFFPRRELWFAGNLRRMQTEMIAAHAAKRKDADEDDKPRRASVKVSEFKEALENLQRMTARYQQVSEEMDHLRKENSELRAENQRLREERAELVGRIRELERIVERELQPA